MSEKRGRYSRGYLPHIDAEGRSQFLSWRLADSLPLEQLDQWRQEVLALPESERKRELSSRIEKYCDSGKGACVLAHPYAGRAVQESLLYDHGRRYFLHAWVVMPNHVHALLTPKENVTLEEIMRVGKSVTATTINKYFGQSGRLWEPDYFDRLIRNPDHFEKVRRYIEWNPVKAKLCQDPSLYPWSSANPDAQKRLEVLVQEGARKRSAAP